MSDLDQTFKAAVAPITEELAMIEVKIREHEAELVALKMVRTRGRKLLAVLDPRAAAPKGKKRSGASPVSDAQLTKILADIHNMNGSGPFSARSVSDQNGVHATTMSKALKVLHERGVIRLDHMGGPRSTTKFYALVGGDDA